jgi:CheY-like chemotaxis protein
MKILLVDDDPVIRRAIASHLIKLGHRVSESWNGLQALKVYSDCLLADNFDLVITDYSMPGLTGAELIQKLRKLEPHLKIVMVSASDGVKNLLVTMKLEDVPLVKKPFRLRELEAACGV